MELEQFYDFFYDLVINMGLDVYIERLNIAINFLLLWQFRTVKNVSTTVWAHLDGCWLDGAGAYTKYYTKKL